MANGINPSHLHYRRKCIFCNQLMSWCKCPGTNPDTGSMKTLQGICPKCTEAAKLKKDNKQYVYFKDGSSIEKISPKTPLKLKTFFLKAGEGYFYYVDPWEIYQRWTTEFCDAGNWCRYPFIPKWEYWVAITESWDEICIDVKHEYGESFEMMHGYDYDTAHMNWTKLDDFCLGNVAGKPGTDETFVNTLLTGGGIG